MRLYNRDFLYQWDVNQKVTGTFKVDDEIHFYNIKQSTALIVKAYELNGTVVADIPNILLQSSHPITAYYYVKQNDIAFTIEEEKFHIIQRAQPDDYVYTETEILTITTVVNKALEDAKDSGEFKGDKGEKGDKGDKGDTGETGANGSPGYTPQRGTDYWTESDKAEIQHYIDSQIGLALEGEY